MKRVFSNTDGQRPRYVASGCYYGARIRRRQLDGITLASHRYAPGQYIPLHAHENAYLSFCLRGSYSEARRGRTLDCTRATVLFHPEGESHRDRFHASGGLVFMLEIAPNWMERVRESTSARGLDSSTVLTGGALFHMGTRLYESFLDEDPTARLMCEGLALEIMAMLVQARQREAGGRPRTWLHHVTEYLEASFARRVGLTEVAAIAGLHPVHLAREFRRYHRTSVGGYVRRLRVDYACRELSRASATIAQIALDAGFSDQSHMTNVFRRMIGTTPAAYRKALSRV